MSNSKQGSSASRKRGIRASRSKLDRAMIAAGIKTQSALAQKIAEQEHLPTPPKDMVNRAFRQLPVESMSLERIAEALSVPAYQLYLTSEDNALLESKNNEPGSQSLNYNPAQTPQLMRTNARNRWKYLTGSVFFLLVVLAIFMSQPPPATPLAPYQAKDISDLKLAIVAQSNAFSSSLKAALSAKLSSSVRLVKNWPSKPLLEQDKLEWSKILETDFVLTWQTKQLDRYTQLQVYLLNRKQRVLLYNDAMLSASMDDLEPALSDKISQTLFTYWQTGKVQAYPGLTLNEEALQQFMLAMQYLNQENTLLNLSRVEARLQRALRIDGQFARAQGALCTALLRKASLSSDTAMINELETLCEQALALAPVEEALQGMANFLRAKGRQEEAMAYYQQILDDNPGYTDALFGQFKALQKQAALKKQPALYQQALDIIAIAIAQEPQSWRGYFLKSHLLYRLGKPQEAITALEISAELEPNFNNLNNLGTMYFCQGDMAKSKDAYVQVSQLERDPSWIIEHQLASLFQFLGETDKAVEYAERGMTLLDTEQVDGHFDPWITKALAYQAHGNEQIAHASFDKALQIAERLRVAGKDPDNTQIQLVYIKVADAYIDNKIIKDPLRQSLLDELNRHANKATTPNALVRLMLAYVMLQEYQPAQPIYQQIGSMCPGFVKNPILAPLAS